MKHTQTESYSSQTVDNDIQSLTTINNNTDNVEQTAVPLEKIPKKRGRKPKENVAMALSCSPKYTKAPRRSTRNKRN